MGAWLHDGFQGVGSVGGEVEGGAAVDAEDGPDGEAGFDVLFVCVFVCVCLCVCVCVCMCM